MRRLSSKLILPNITLGVSVLLFILGCANTSAESSAEETRTQGGEEMTEVSQGVHRQTMTVDGNEREFSYYVPGNSASKQLPIVIYLHGYGDNMRHILGEGLVSSASSKWMDVAEREGFLVVYPLGMEAEGWRSKPAWNDCRRDAKNNPKVDDVAFVRQLINYTVENLNGDRKRVYVTGMSNGGHMAMRVAMEMSSEVAAVAPVVALLPRANKCSPPSEPVPILMMHGTADPIAPFEGGAMKGGRGDVLSARETANTWVKWNKLESAPERTSEVEDKNKSDDSRIVKRIREGSPAGNAVIAYEVQGAGHTEPSRAAKMSGVLQAAQGNQNNDIEMAETIWEFFRTRSR
ncbi:PHB depolymerase family esterase [Haliea sp. E1-2-M8]|uniref:alpha/beta hydrolase family esterase n=1 Tax=Haliea sp. E1-2-M8 TaxID=3064706 RepID=UPI0027196967|nr:PHB depolymerase family esterase [Haliea sp. E1-2-M8]MDO8861547.1 PHB depolymerase family esterase [Haliea sp. E1-2-M8]